jgi:dephospho-CoA kinase
VNPVAGKTLVIGISGGIASGKSLAAKAFEQCGARVIDSDEMVHRALQDPEVIDTYRRWWGDGVCQSDGSIDRKAVADIVFGDSSQRRRMEAFLYPRLERDRRSLVERYRADDDVVAIVINSPLLYEVGLDGECDVVVFVDSDRESRVRRAIEDRGWTVEEFDRREKLQNPLDIKKRAADYIVENNSSADALRSRVTTLFDRILSDNG